MKKSRAKKIGNIVIFVVLMLVMAVLSLGQIHVILVKDFFLMIGHFRLSGMMMIGIIVALCFSISVFLNLRYKTVGFIASTVMLALGTACVIGGMVAYNVYDYLPVMVVWCVLVSVNVIIFLCDYEVRQHEKEVIKVYSTDTLTNLPNRQSLKNEITAKIKQKTPFALLFIDIDNFKNINDTLGHNFGDEVLCDITDRWIGVMNENDYLARLGGDEFAVISCGFETREQMLTHAREMMNVLASKIIVSGTDLYLSASMGMSFFPDDTKLLNDLLRYSDAAMFKAKKSGKQKICIFERSFMDDIEDTIAVESMLRKALADDSLELAFQPQYCCDVKKLRGFETLLRLSDAADGVISPTRFIPVAERSNIIIDVDRWVIEHALHIGKTLIETNPDIVLSVNVSVKYLSEKTFVDEIVGALEAVHFPAGNLEIEITESSLISSMESVVTKLNQLKYLGIMVALDDFGTGYASLRYLTKLPIDLLKVDKSFVDLMLNSENEATFVKTIISMGHLLNHHVIAEGVETEAQLQMLRSLGCDYIQGFFWGKPVEFSIAKKIAEYESVVRLQEQV